MQKLTKVPFSVSLVIPVFNNGNTVVSQIKMCEKILSSICTTYEILPCDDKSTDNSASLLRECFIGKRGYKLIFHKKNLGIPKTIKSLYDKALFDYIVLFSVDGDWNPIDINNLLITVLRTKADIVIGVRNKSSYNMYRRLISFMYNFLPVLLFQVKTYDAASIKVFKNKLYKSLHIRSTSVFFESEMIIKAKKNGYKIATYPVYFRKKNKRIGGGGNPSLVITSFLDMLRFRFTKL